MRFWPKISLDLDTDDSESCQLIKMGRCWYHQITNCPGIHTLVLVLMVPWLTSMSRREILPCQNYLLSLISLIKYQMNHLLLSDLSEFFRKVCHITKNFKSEIKTLRVLTAINIFIDFLVLFLYICMQIQP